MHDALVNRAPVLAISCDHDLACSFFHCPVLLASGLLACAHALVLHYRLYFSPPSVDPVVAVASYCTGVVSKSVVPDGIIVSKVTIVLAATKREAGIVAAIQASAITGA